MPQALPLEASQWYAFYTSRLGEERFRNLCKLFQSAQPQLCFANGFEMSQVDVNRAEYVGIPNVYYLRDSNPGAQGDAVNNESPPSASKFLQGLCSTSVATAATNLQLSENPEKGYYLDVASAVAAMSLAPTPGDRILDICAAPGGKSLLLANALFKIAETEQEIQAKEKSFLLCNEANLGRFGRLKGNVSSRFPEEVMSEGIKFSRVDVLKKSANSLIEVHAPYDKILVDAPCSSDRYLARNALERHQWSPVTVKNNAERQLKILAYASRLCKPRGSIAYVTCALADEENDEVIHEFLRTNVEFKAEPPIELLPRFFATLVPKIRCSEDTSAGEEHEAFWRTRVHPEAKQFGCHFLPAPGTGNFGPLYCAILRKSNVKGDC